MQPTSHIFDVRQLFNTPTHQTERQDLTPYTERSEELAYDPNLIPELRANIITIIEINSRLAEKAREEMERGRDQLASAVREGVTELKSAPQEGRTLEENADLVVQGLKEQLAAAERQNEAQRAAANENQERMSREIQAQAARMQQLSSDLEKASSGDQAAIREELEQLKKQNEQLQSDKLKLEEGAKKFVRESDMKREELKKHYKQKISQLIQYKESWLKLKEIQKLSNDGEQKAQELIRTGLLSPAPSSAARKNGSGLHDSLLRGQVVQQHGPAEGDTRTDGMQEGDGLIRDLKFDDELASSPEEAHVKTLQELTKNEIHDFDFNEPFDDVINKLIRLEWNYTKIITQNDTFQKKFKTRTDDQKRNFFKSQGESKAGLIQLFQLFPEKDWLLSSPFQ